MGLFQNLNGSRCSAGRLRGSPAGAKDRRGTSAGFFIAYRLGMALKSQHAADWSLYPRPEERADTSRAVATEDVGKGGLPPAGPVGPNRRT